MLKGQILQIYKESLSSIEGIDNIAIGLDRASKFYVQKPIEACNLIVKETSTFISDNAYFENSVTQVSATFNTLSNSELESVVTLVNSHEKLAMVLFEPYLVGIVGTTAFMSLSASLHKEESFRIFMQKVVDKQYAIRYNAGTRFVTFLCNLQLNANKLSVGDLAAQGSILSLAAGLSVYLYHSFFPAEPFQPSTLVQDTFAMMQEGRGFNNSTIDNSREFLNKLAYETGKFVSRVWQGFYSGLFAGNEATMRTVAKELDKAIDVSRKG